MSRKILFLGTLLIILYSLALNLPFLWEREFQGEAARRVVAALEMMERGEYVIPYIEGRPYLLKPPFYNWVLIGFFRVFGSHSEFVARLSSVTAATLAALFLALVFRATVRPKGLLWTLPGLIFLSTPEVLDKACRAEIDMTYTFLVTLAVFGWFYFHEIRREPYLAWGFGLFFTALATLTKTFQAVVFFYTPVIPYLFLKRRGRNLFSLPHLLGLSIYGTIFMAWFLPASEKIGSSNILSAWLGEYLSTEAPLEPSGFLGHLLKFPMEYIQGHLPWAVFLLGWKEQELRSWLSPRCRDLVLYSLLLVALSFPLYWLLPGTRLRYLLPTEAGMTFMTVISVWFFMEKGKLPKAITLFLSFIMGAILLAIPVFIRTSWQRLHLSENAWGLSFLAITFLIAIIFFLLKEDRIRIIYLFIFVLFIKLTFAGVYFPYQEKYRNHYTFAARQLQKKIPKGADLCDYRMNTPHLTYYLKYRFRWIESIYLVLSPEELEKCRYVISTHSLPSEIKARAIMRTKARRTNLILWEVK